MSAEDPFEINNIITNLFWYFDLSVSDYDEYWDIYEDFINNNFCQDFVHLETGSDFTGIDKFIEFNQNIIPLLDSSESIIASI